MKRSFVWLFFLDAAATENKGGGFTAEEKADLADAIKGLETALEKKNKDAITTAVKEHVGTINDAIKKFQDWQTVKDDADKKNQEALDNVLAKMKESQKALASTTTPVRSFHQAFVEELTKPENLKGLDTLRKGNRFRMEIPGFVDMRMPDVYSSVINDGMKRGESEFDKKMNGQGLETKTVGDMTQSNLTGDPVATYSPRQVILPAQKVNARDLFTTVRSETGLYVQYKETGGEGGIGLQTEGSAKSQIDYDFTEVKTVSKYIAGFARFSKQLRRNLPFLQNTLPRLLQRDFYKKENRYFWDVMFTNATSYSSSETDDVKQLMDIIGQQMQNDFMASYGIMSWIAMTRLNKLLYTNGYYQGSGGVLSQSDGSIRISGVPALPVTWIPTNDQTVVFDNDYIERVEVEGLAVEFFEQDGNNVTENKITARIECFEELNCMLGASMLKMDLGNSSTS